MDIDACDTFNNIYRIQFHAIDFQKKRKKGPPVDGPFLYAAKLICSSTS